MEDLFGTLTELGIGGAIVGMFYLFTLRFEKQLDKQRILHEEEREKQELRHAKEREKQELRHAEERKEDELRHVQDRKEWIDTAKDFKSAIIKSTETITGLRLELANKGN